MDNVEEFSQLPLVAPVLDLLGHGEQRQQRRFRASSSATVPGSHSSSAASSSSSGPLRRSRPGRQCCRPGTPGSPRLRRYAEGSSSALSIRRRAAQGAPDRAGAGGRAPLHRREGEARCRRPRLLAADHPQLVGDKVCHRVIQLLLAGRQLVLDAPWVTLLEQQLAGHVPHDLLGDLAELLRRNLYLARAAVPISVQVEQAKQAPQARVVPRVRGGGHQDQPVSAPGHGLGGLVPLALPADVTLAVDRQRESVRLVNHGQVPVLLRRLERLPRPGRAQEVPAHHDVIMLIPRVPGQRRIEVAGTKLHELDLEPLGQLPDPLRAQVSRSHHQEPITGTAENQLLHVQARP